MSKTTGASKGGPAKGTQEGRKGVAAAKGRAKRAAPGPRYFELVKGFPLRPIKTNAEYAQARKMMMELTIISDADIKSDEDDYLDVLTDLMEDYEDEHEPEYTATPPQMLEFLMDQAGVRAVEVARATKIHKTTLSSLLAGRRPFTYEHVAALSRYFKVSPQLFYGPTDPATVEARS
jgi:HTH-type transcriptional regulator / antitoxin HigA